MHIAKDKLIVALDVESAARALELFDSLREHVATFKIGMQLFTAAGPEVVRRIVSRGNRVFLDLKYHDIPNTVSRAAVEAARLGVFMFNVHTLGGSEMMKRTSAAVAEATAREGLTRPKVLGVTLLTSSDEHTLDEIGMTHRPASLVPRLAALADSSDLDGVVASAHEIHSIRDQVSDPNFLIVCPGVRSVEDPADDQRRIMSAGDAIRAGADFVVVGRPILNAGDPTNASLRFIDEIDQAIIDSHRVNSRSR